MDRKYMTKNKIMDTLVIVKIDGQIPKETKNTHPDWYRELVFVCEEFWKVYSIAQPSVWEHHEALGLDDLREVVLLRKKKREIYRVWSKRPFKVKKH